MFGSLRRDDAQREALERIRAWTRERFALAEGDAILATELPCASPGCPPLETVVAFWTAAERRHQFKVFKRAVQVTPDDLPYAWMKDALWVPNHFVCDCC